MARPLLIACFVVGAIGLQLGEHARIRGLSDAAKNRIDQMKLKGDPCPKIFRVLKMTKLVEEADQAAADAYCTPHSPLPPSEDSTSNDEAPKKKGRWTMMAGKLDDMASVKAMLMKMGGVFDAVNWGALESNFPSNAEQAKLAAVVKEKLEAAGMNPSMTQLGFFFGSGCDRCILDSKKGGNPSAISDKWKDQVKGKDEKECGILPTPDKKDSSGESLVKKWFICLSEALSKTGNEGVCPRNEGHQVPLGKKGCRRITPAEFNDKNFV